MALDELPADIRESTLTALRLRRPKLVRDLTDGLCTEPGLEHINRADLAGILITMLAATIRAGWVDARTASIQELSRFAPPLTVRQLIRAVHHAERTVLGELSLEEGIGASVDSWQIAARAISAAAVEISGIVAENHAAVGALRDPLTTLLSARMNGGDRTERVALLPTSVTIPGAASLLGLSNREVSRLLRGGELRATRRGRHLHIERAAIDAYRHRS